MALGYADIKRCLADAPLPAAFVDLAAFDRNVSRVAEMVRPHGITVRPASKSLRVPALLRRVLDHPSGLLSGVMCFSAPEVEHLAGQGFDDLLLAYPIHQARDLQCLARVAAAGSRVSAVVDSRSGAERLGRAASEHGTTLDVLLCVDMSLKLAGLHIGVRRSPLHSPDQVRALAQRVAETPGLRFHGLMAYEAQIAGLGDASPFEPHMNAAKALLKRISVRELSKRRNEIVDSLKRDGLSPTLVNGGGSGSLDTTTPASGVTEVTAGSAFLKSHLFDYYSNPHMRELEPAGFFALEITRTPARNIATCLGGGYVASGASQADKAPLPYLPHGLKLLPAEMAGEVQTPLQLPAGLQLEQGDMVVFRHAKAGELAERFNHYLLIEEGGGVSSAPTYRGQGQCFL